MATLPAQAPTVPPITRADLGAAYLRLDQLLAGRTLDAATQRGINTTFDQTTLAFFGGRSAEAVQGIQRMSALLLGDSSATSAIGRAVSVRVRAEPRATVRGEGGPRWLVDLPYAVRGRDTLQITLAIRNAKNRQVAQGTAVLLAASAGVAEISIANPALLQAPVGRYALWISVDGSPAIRAGDWFVLPADPATTRAALEGRLSRITTGDPQAIAAVRARLTNLVRVPAADNSAQFLADPGLLASQLDEEVRALERGVNPFAHLSGDRWRIIRLADGKDVPVRVIAAEEVARSRQPVPLLIVLHGAGGDENMFPDSYGAGLVVREAARRGALVASPATVAFQRDPAALDSLVAVLQREYAVDASRIYLVGHSMGAAAAYRTAAQRPNTIAASALLSGAGAPIKDAPPPPPSLWISAELDPLIPPARISPAAAAARTAGAQVEYRERPNVGHTLIVGPALPEALDWLFAQRRPLP